MDSIQGDLSQPSQFGGTLLKQELITFKRENIDPIFADLDLALQTAVDKILDEAGNVSYQAKPLNEISNERPNTGNINMNGKQLTNVAGIPDISEGGINQYALFGVNVATMIAYDTASILLNTNYCGPLSETTSLKDKRVTNMGDAFLVTPDDPDGAAKTKQGINYSTLVEMALTTAPEDRMVYGAGDKKIIELGDAVIYTDADVRTLPDELEANVFNIDQSLVAKFESTAMNLKRVQEVAVSLETEERKHFVAQSKQIKMGAQATDPKDFVTLDQVVHQEEGQAEWIATDPVSEPQRRDFVFEDDRIVMVSNPKTNILTGKFAIFEDTDPVVPTRLLDEGLQVANLNHVKKETDKCLKIDQNIDLKDQYRTRNALPAEADDDYVINSQCKERSGKKQDGTVDFIGPLLGGIAGLITGAISGGISVMVGAGGAGLTALGSLASSSVGGAAAGGLASGVKIGSEAAFEAAREGASDGTKQLIDNLQDDIANGGSGSGDPAPGGNLFTGASSFDGLVRLVRNSQVGLFEAFV